MSRDWIYARLGELASKIGSGATPKGGQSAYQQAGIPFIRSTNVVFFDFKRQGLVFINKRQADDLRNVEVHANDVLLNITGASIGRVTIAPSDMEGARVNQHVCIIRPRDGLDARFLRAFLSSSEMQSKIGSEQYGVTRQALTKKQILDFEIPLAPINEQRRIADKIDYIISQVRACCDHLDRVPTILTRFRQAVLASATSGELTREWRSKQGPTPAPWQSVTIGELLEGKPRNGYSPRAVEHPTKVKTLTLTATTAGHFRSEFFKYIAEEIPPNSHLWLEPDDILIQRANTIDYVGVSAIYAGPPGEYIYPDLMMKCRANETVMTKYLHIILSSETVRKYFRDHATGTAGNMPKINQQIVLDAPARLPPINEQQEIIRRVEALFLLAERLGDRHQAARNLAERITPALLAKAFRGELVPPDPNDESASVLIGRIRSSVGAAPPETFKPEIDRKSRMTKPTGASIKQAIRLLPDRPFTFEDLRQHVSIDYDTLRDILFLLLDEPNPCVKQIFDEKLQEMRLIRGEA